MKRSGCLFLVAIAFFSFSACYSREGGGGSTSQIPALMSPVDISNKDAAAKNNEGVDHLVQTHYDISEKLFREAVELKPDFAEAHFNLGIALDGMGKHEEATEAFKKAIEAGSGNPKIAENAVLKKHLGM